MRLDRYIIVVFVIFLCGCKSMQLPQERALLKMPENFANEADTLSSAKINWKDFFKDPSLISLIDTALQNNLDLLVAYQNIEIAKANLRFTKMQLIPTLDANLGAKITKYGDYTQEWAGNKTTEMTPGNIIPMHLPDYLIGFSSNWEMDVWGKLKSKKQAEQARYLASIEGKNWLQTNLIAEIANNYYELLALDKEIEILNQNIALQEKSLNLIKIQKEAGHSTELAIKQFEAQILNKKVETKLISRYLVEIENNINLLIGRYPQEIKRSSFEKAGSDLTIVTGTPEQLLQNRADIRLAEQELISSRFDVQAARKSFYPTVNVGASMGLNGFSPTLLFSLPSFAYNLAGGLTAPLLNRSSLEVEFKTASALQLTALYNYQKTILESYTEVYNQVKILDNLGEVYELKKQEVEILDSAITYSNLLFQTDYADYLEVLLAQQNSLQAKLDLLTYQKQQEQSAVNLYKALGGGW